MPFPESKSDKKIMLSEMQRLGFWPIDKSIPALDDALAKQEAALIQRLRVLGADLANIENPEKILRKLRRNRIKNARKIHFLARQKKAEQHEEKKKLWQLRSKTDIFFLGMSVSAGLGQQINQRDKLKALSLPLFNNVEELALQMGISLRELRFLAFERRVSTSSHYRYFEIAKKTGGTRLIAAPMPRLKRAQYWILDNLLAKVPVHDAAHGFIKKRSIVTNAKPHAGKAIVINLDLENFFPSIPYPRVKGVFRSLGYSEQLATIFALICTQTLVEEVSIDHDHFFIRRGNRHLPQGAPTSPALTNILCRRFDKRLTGIAKKLGFQYTRYADDLTFSVDGQGKKNVGKLLWRVKSVIADEGFSIHPTKQHVMRAHQQQRVTGLVVNEKLTHDRKNLRRFRAVLHQLEQRQYDGKHWQGNYDVLNALTGYAHFLKSIDNERFGHFLARIEKIKQALPFQRVIAQTSIEDARSKNETINPSKVSKKRFRYLSAQGEEPWSHWWRPKTEVVKSDGTNDNDFGEKREAWLAERKWANQKRPIVRFLCQLGIVIAFEFFVGNTLILLAIFCASFLGRLIMRQPLSWFFFSIIMAIGLLLNLIIW